MSILNRITELAEISTSTKVIRAHLTIDGYSAKEIKEGMELAELSVTRASFKTDFYAWLLESPRTEAEFLAYLSENGSANVLKHESSHRKVWELTLDIREALANES